MEKSRITIGEFVKKYGDYDGGMCPGTTVCLYSYAGEALAGNEEQRREFEALCNKLDDKNVMATMFDDDTDNVKVDADESTISVYFEASTPVQEVYDAVMDEIIERLKNEYSY